MDWATHDHTRRRRAATAAPVVDCTHWRLVGPSGKVVTCATVRDTFGLEVRAGYSDLDLLRSERVQSPEMAAMLAADWKAAVLARGSFTDLETPN